MMLQSREYRKVSSERMRMQTLPGALALIWKCTLDSRKALDAILVHDPTLESLEMVDCVDAPKQRVQESEL